MPIPSNALIEGYPAPGDGDRHVLVLDKDNCWLYEMYNSQELSVTNWSADSTAIWDMTINEQRPYTWTSADAAGLPIFPGLVRYDEVAAGAINHAIRFTVPVTQQAFTAPATHWASSVTDPDAPPMGTRLRLQASFDISGFSQANQVILTALKKYGMILADNGSAIYISGAPNSGWNNDDLHNLTSLTGADFDVVTTGPVYTESNVPTGASPAIGSFNASATYIREGRIGDAELVDHWRNLQHHLADGGPGARHLDHGESEFDHHLHLVLDQSVRTEHCHCHGCGPAHNCQKVAWWSGTASASSTDTNRSAISRW